jgi:hypothetical protein
MKIFLKVFVSLLLLFNGIGAIYGGWHLMTKPDGSSLTMPLDMLKHSPFNDYLVPGIILFIANGLFSLFAFVMLFANYKRYSLLIMAQGIILVIWIIVQIIMIQTIGRLHVIYASAGVLLIICGGILSLKDFQEIERQEAVF